MENLCVFIGNLGGNPDVRPLDDGAKVAQFSMACTEKGYKKKDGTDVPERKEWIPVVVWRGLADVIEKYTKKGSRVYVRGKFRTRTYEDDKGVKHWRTYIDADYIELLDSKRETNTLPTEVLKSEAAQRQSPAAQSQYAPAPEVSSSPENKNDDLPF